MQTILIIGAGKSSTYLIDYLLQQASIKNRKIIVADVSEAAALQKIKSHPFGKAVLLNVEDKEERRALIAQSDVVISMLPAFMHPSIGKDCVDLSKHFFTASYESEDLKKLESEIRSKDLLFLNECGLDPGIDHMSAMKIIAEEKEKGNEIISFKSYCGGILAPESEDNPWKYKFTWNPRNVVLAGQGVSKYIEKGQLKFIPYHRLFERLESVEFEGAGEFQGYANRDSLSYRKIYGIENIPTLLRGTLRRTGFSTAWNVFVQLGMTDDTYQVQFHGTSTLRVFINSFLPFHDTKSVEEKLRDCLPWVDNEVFSKLEWLGMFSEQALPIAEGSPATILQKILERKWALHQEDKDMVVLQHQFVVKSHYETKEITSSLVCIGENEAHTAMSKTVGLPLGIAVDLFLDGKIASRGLQIPILSEFYEPILAELGKNGIVFKESSKLINS